MGDPFSLLIDRNSTAVDHAFDIAGAVASMTESDSGVESEKASYNIPGEPGQRHEAGRALDVQSDVGELYFLLAKCS